jgi:phosphoserine phosphatase RsbU/P
MPDSPIARALSLWRKLTPSRRVAAVISVIYLLAAGAEAAGGRVPAKGLLALFFSWALFIWFLAFVGWFRRRMLWSLRNRLLVAYVFIAVVPILLLLSLASISAYILYAQLGSYVLSAEIHRTLEQMGTLAEAEAAFPGETAASGDTAGAVPAHVPSAARMALNIPGLEIRQVESSELLPAGQQETDRRFEGLVQQGDQLWLRAVAMRRVGAEKHVVTVSAPVTPELLDRIPLELGRIRCEIVRLEQADEKGKSPIKFTLGRGQEMRVYVPYRGISSQRRELPPPAYWLDMEVTGFSNFEAVSLGSDSKPSDKIPVVAAFSARPSRLNRVLFASLGDWSSLPFILLMVAGVLFLLIEAGALVTGTVLTRTMTRSVSELYNATQRVKAGDLSYRIRDVRNDQLGALATSFNEMTVAVARSIEEQRQRERLESEIAIAREVQDQLFPRSVPHVPGLHLVASCRAARMVSGDYYDFITLGDAELAFIVADIAGKGISAALLMASLQASLRSQLLDEYGIRSTAEVIARLNRHLITTTPDDRFATLFFGIYNSKTRVLRYTNAGHLPPLYFSSAGVSRLETGGTIVGMFRDCEYEQGTVTLEPGGLLVAYTDGISEPENHYGEQFGRQRIIDVIERNRGQRPEAILDALVAAVENWASTPEQSDDMTILLASAI